MRTLPRWPAARRPHPVRMLRSFLSWYGAGPLHLLTLAGCFALAGYAAVELLPGNFVGIPLWLIGAVIGHDLLLMPLYALADRSALAVFRHHRPALPDVAWINYLRVPAVLSGMLLLIWFPLIFRLPSRFPATTTLPLDPYLWHWLGITGGLFLLSAGALALRLRTSRAKPNDASLRSGQARRLLDGRVVGDPRREAGLVAAAVRHRGDGRADAGGLNRPSCLRAPGPATALLPAGPASAPACSRTGCARSRPPAIPLR